MNHQHFEAWNLDRSNLSPDQMDALIHHLETCPDCQRAFSAWECAQMEIKSVKMMEAPAGFSRRFQTSLTSRQALAHRRQTMKLLTFLGVSLLIVLILLGVYGLTQSEPAAWLGSIIRVVAGIPFDIQELQFIAAFWLPRIPLHVWLLVSVVIIAWMMVLILTGTLTYKRYQRQGATSK